MKTIRRFVVPSYEHSYRMAGVFKWLTLEFCFLGLVVAVVGIMMNAPLWTVIVAAICIFEALGSVALMELHVRQTRKYMYGKPRRTFRFGVASRMVNRVDLFFSGDRVKDPILNIPV